MRLFPCKELLSSSGLPVTRKQHLGPVFSIKCDSYDHFKQADRSRLKGVSSFSYDTRGDATELNGRKKVGAGVPDTSTTSATNTHNTHFMEHTSDTALSSTPFEQVTAPGGPAPSPPLPLLPSLSSLPGPPLQFLTLSVPLPSTAQVCFACLRKMPLRIQRVSSKNTFLQG